MSRYKSRHTGATIDDAVDRATGYGLGANAATPTTNDADSCTLTGWYAISSMSNCPITYGLLRVETWYNGCIFQTAYEMSSGVVVQRRCQNSEWKPWEYVNPPMQLGVEYRTTERISGKPVYIKLVNLGNLPNNTTEDFPFTADTNARCFEVCAQVGYFEYAGGWRFTLPSGNYLAPVGVDNKIRITVNQAVDNSTVAHPVTAIVKYYKTTD